MNETQIFLLAHILLALELKQNHPAILSDLVINTRSLITETDLHCLSYLNLKEDMPIFKFIILFWATTNIGLHA